MRALLSSGELPAEDIGVITPYAAQAALLQQKRLGGGSEGKQQAVEVSSVDGFQGREKEVILFSCVRANPERRLGFLADHRRLNVAITRARCGLILAGNEATLGADETWRAYLQYLRKRGCVVPAGELGLSAEAPA